MSELRIEVDIGAPTPPYEQIRAQIAAHVAAGALRPGDRLPTVRALAQDLGVAVGTVNRAYRELEAGGLVATRRRTGTVVTADTDAAHREVERARAAGVVAAAVAELRRLGLGDEEILDHVRGALLPREAGSGPAG